MPVIIAIFACFFIFILYQNISRFIKNEQSPVLTEPAHLVDKISDTMTDANGHVSTTLLLVFHVGVGEETLKCSVPGRVYRAVQKDVHGMLTHQGTRFRCFEFNGIRVEK